MLVLQCFNILTSLILASGSCAWTAQVMWSAVQLGLRLCDAWWRLRTRRKPATCPTPWLPFSKPGCSRPSGWIIRRYAKPPLSRSRGCVKCWASPGLYKTWSSSMSCTGISRTWQFPLLKTGLNPAEGERFWRSTLVHRCAVVCCHIM